MDDHFMPIHKRATCKDQCQEFRLSKYAQSDMGGVIDQIKADLMAGKLVLFSGTPCQVDGVKQAVGQRLRERLILVDLICHGVPGPLIWRSYLDYLCRKYGVITKAIFRDKSFGWNVHRESFEINGNRYNSDTYRRIFYSNVALRMSCYKCPYTNFNRPSDITLGDFWGYKGSHFTDNKGLSLVVVSTLNGLKIFDSIKSRIDFEESNMRECIQPQLQHPSPMNPQRLRFEEDFKDRDFKYIAKKYSDWNFQSKLKAIYAYFRTIIPSTHKL